MIDLSPAQATDPAERARARAALDGLEADAVTVATRNAYRDVEGGR